MAEERLKIVLTTKNFLYGIFINPASINPGMASPGVNLTTIIDLPRCFLNPCSTCFILDLFKPKYPTNFSTEPILLRLPIKKSAVSGIKLPRAERAKTA